MFDFIKKIISSKPAKVICLFAIIFGWFAAFVTGIAIPISAGFWFWSIPISVAVIIALPTYIKALKWALKQEG